MHVSKTESIIKFYTVLFFIFFENSKLFNTNLLTHGLYLLDPNTIIIKLYLMKFSYDHEVKKFGEVLDRLSLPAAS